ncbi:Uncharacterised protein [Vibrio cholerae]|nr:Uncharacterised protein [Vibrio cholerae]CSB26051.1 Uncharacterised protein [Vibrio cholerae]
MLIITQVFNITACDFRDIAITTLDLNCNRASTHHTIIDDINIPIDAKIMFSVNFSVYTTQLLSYKMLKKSFTSVPYFLICLILRKIKTRHIYPI